MPLQVSAVAGGSAYASPFIGPIDHTVHVKVDISGLTIAEVDADGYLKPGVLLKVVGGLGVLIGAAAAAPLAVVEAAKLSLVTVPPTDLSLAAETNDCFVACATHGLINRDVAEDLMARAYTANELASFVTAGSHLAITIT